MPDPQQFNGEPLVRPAPEPAAPADSSPSDTPLAGSLRRHLRAGIADVHARLDAAFSGFDLSRRRDYAAFLTVTASVLPEIERRLERDGIEATLPDWPRRRRRGALLGDLERLGVAPPPCLDTLPPVSTADRHGHLGVVYALEGSRSGARLLIRAVERSSDPLVRRTTAFLEHGVSDGLWAGFVERLAQEDADAAETARAIRAARSVFEAYLLAVEAHAGCPA